MLKSFLFLLILSFSFSLNKKERNIFTIIKLQQSNPAFFLIEKEIKIYYFEILGNFSKKPSKNESIEINLISPNGAKAKCSPEESLESGFKCYLSLSEIALKEEIIIDPHPLESDIFYFINWNEFFKKNSIKVYYNTFITQDFRIEKRNNKYVYLLFGNWENIFYNEINNAEFELELDNTQKTKLNCNFNKMNPNQINCFSNEIEAIKYKDILVKFGEKYFYKLNEFDGTKINIEFTPEYNTIIHDLTKEEILILESSNYNTNISTILDEPEFEEKISFKTCMKDENENIFIIYCKLWYSFRPIIFCKLEADIEVGNHNVTLDNYSLNYKGYLINFSFIGKYNIYKSNIVLPLIYSKEQIINISDKEEIYELKFKVKTYHNETLILKCDAYNLKLLEECFINNKDLVCKIKKQELIAILTKNGNYFFLAFYNSIIGLSEFRYSFGIKINLDIYQKENIFVEITKSLVNTIGLPNHFTYETNIIEDIPNIITEPFKIDISLGAWCYFRKYTNKPLLFYCHSDKAGIFSLENIKQEIIIDNVHSKYNFIIKPTTNNEKITIIEDPKYNNYAFFAIPSVLNFYLNEKIYIDIFISFNTSIKINPDSDILECKKINRNAVRCLVPKSHFENKTSGYYFVHYLNPYTNKYTPFYEMSNIRVDLPKNDQDKELINQNITKNNQNPKSKIFSIPIIFIILLAASYSSFYAYREYLRKKKGKLFENLIDIN